MSPHAAASLKGKGASGLKAGAVNPEAKASSTRLDAPRPVYTLVWRDGAGERLVPLWDVGMDMFKRVTKKSRQKLRRDVTKAAQLEEDAGRRDQDLLDFIDVLDKVQKAGRKVKGQVFKPIHPALLRSFATGFVKSR